MSQADRGRVFVLNAPVLTGYGDWRMEGPISVSTAVELLSGGFTSAVGHAGSAEFLSRLLGVNVPVNRIRAQLQPGDCALILRLKERLPEGKVLTAEEMERVKFELAILRRLA